MTVPRPRYREITKSWYLFSGTAHKQHNTREEPNEENNKYTNHIIQHIYQTTPHRSGTVLIVVNNRRIAFEPPSSKVAVVGITHVIILGAWAAGRTPENKRGLEHRYESSPLEKPRPRPGHARHREAPRSGRDQPLEARHERLALGLAVALQVERAVLEDEREGHVLVCNVHAPAEDPGA